MKADRDATLMMAASRWGKIDALRHDRDQILHYTGEKFPRLLVDNSTTCSIRGEKTSEAKHRFIN
jgi:hypothetical protein